MSMNNDIPSRSNPAVTELVLYARNDALLHDKMVNRVRKSKPELFHSLALGFIDAAWLAARAYRREFGTEDSCIFTAHDLLQAAAELCEWYSQEYGGKDAD